MTPCLLVNSYLRFGVKFLQQLQGPCRINFSWVADPECRGNRLFLKLNKYLRT